MATQDLRDRNGNKIGSIDVDSQGTQVLKDKNGNRLGTYEPRSNTTRDKNGNRVGTGNILTTLLR
ncbi:MAG: hypothetical protein FWD64_09015 [Acidobacteriaceae bacterium]|nr:hypothetical protein [Acidobacteriaceae bacterium]